MKNLSKETRKSLVYLAAGVGLALFGLVWYRLSGFLGARAAWMRDMGLFVSNGLSRFWSVMPLAAAELIWIFGALGAAGLVIYMGVKRGVKGVLGALCRLALAAGVIYALFALTYLVQFSAPSMGDRLGLEARGYTSDELLEVGLTVVSQLNEVSSRVERDGDGLYRPSASFEELAQRAKVSYMGGSMAEMYNKGSGVLPKKGYLLSKAMSWLDLAGYYFPPTGESVVSTDIVTTSVANTTAHEMAHSFGIGREKEANFAAFLCCLESGDDDLMYSGLFNGYIALNNALYKADKDKWRELYASLSQSVRDDLDAKNRHLAKYEGKINDFGNAVNDAMIKSTGQTDGVRSYGLVVDLIMAYYLK